MITLDRARRFAGRPEAPLAAVALAYAIVQLVVVTPRIRLGWDETVYVSQVSPRIPAAFFSAPRARGVTLLPAPIVAVTSSLTALRVYMTAVSSAGLVIAYWPWTRLLRPAVAGLAALLLASLWMVQFYGNEVMPNLYVAYGAVAAAGWFVLAVRALGGERRRVGAFRPLAWLALSVAFVVLVRPGDGAWLVLPLCVAALLTGRRWPRPLLATVAGAAAGLLPWIVEAYARFGDPLRRLRASSRVEGGLGWHPSAVLMNFGSLNTSLLCRPCGRAYWHLSAFGLWWPLLPFLTAAGIVLAAREGRGRLVALPAACGAALAVQYLFLVGYAAPRFLIPAYALLALPVAECLTGVVRFARWRDAAAGLVAAGLVAAGVVVLAAGQQVVLTRMVASEKASRDDLAWLAAGLRRLGVRPPCTLSGDMAQPLAFYAGCASAEVAGNNASTTVAGLRRMAATRRFADLEEGGRRPGYARGWRWYRVTTPAGRQWHVYVPATTAAAAAGPS